MGAVLAKFRKPKTTIEILENLEKNINEIEQYSLITQAKQKRFVGNFLLMSIGLYIIGFLVFYFAFFPPSWTERITYSIPLLIFPLLIFLMKKVVAWYFQIKLNKNSKELNKLMSEKKKIIERVMEQETYKKAIEILNRFADKSKSYAVATPRSKLNQTITPSQRQQQQEQQQQQQPSLDQQKILSQNLLTADTVSNTISNVLNQQTSTSEINSAIQLQTTPALLSNTDIDVTTPRNTMQIQVQRQQRQLFKTPFPIINLGQQSVLEKIVDYLIGDGPHNRYAMICKECCGHNGMASQEDYQFSAFRCIYCNTMNQSRKTRPIAPKLDNSPVSYQSVISETESEITIDNTISTVLSSLSDREFNDDSYISDEALLMTDVIENEKTITITDTESVTAATNCDDVEHQPECNTSTNVQEMNETETDDNIIEKPLEDKKKD